MGEDQRIYPSENAQINGKASPPPPPPPPRIYPAQNSQINGKASPPPPRIYPAQNSQINGKSSPPPPRIYPAENAQINGKSSPPPRPPPGGTYVFQYPKQQTHNGPSQRRRHFRPEYFTPPRRRRNHCCCCFCWILAFLVLLILIVAIAGVVLYFLYKPQAPKYDVQGIAVKRFAFDKDQALSAQFAVTIRARNPNKKIGVYYEKDNSLAVLFSGKELCSGDFPSFYQGHQNTSVFVATLTGFGVPFSQNLRSSLNSHQAEGKVPLNVVVDVPVKIKVWGWKLPKVIVHMHCRLNVDKLAANRAVKMQDKSCSVHVKLKLWKFTLL